MHKQSGLQTREQTHMHTYSSHTHTYKQSGLQTREQKTHMHTYSSHTHIYKHTNSQGCRHKRADTQTHIQQPHSHIQTHKQSWLQTQESRHRHTYGVTAVSSEYTSKILGKVESIRPL